MSKPKGKGALVLNLVALLVLTGTSWAVSYVHLGDWNEVVALGIAALKVSLVALFFMHLSREHGSVRFAAMTAPVFIALLVAIMAADIVTR